VKLKYLSSGRTSLIAVVNCGGQNATPAAFLETFSSRGRSFSRRGRTPATPPANRTLFAALPIPEIIGGTQIMWAVPEYAHKLLFLQKFSCLDRHCEFTGKFEVRSFFLPVLEIIAIGAFGGLQTPNRGEEEAVGARGWYRSKERWCVTEFLYKP